mmetsp:Transcript_6202/g.10650  ORF Transcript_6202/g.10650 Transcript_6202/m.10650 type:complete len:106 (-) Transcript_6202:585-902(-)
MQISRRVEVVKFPWFSDTQLPVYTCVRNCSLVCGVCQSLLAAVMILIDTKLSQIHNVTYSLNSVLPQSPDSLIELITRTPFMQHALCGNQWGPGNGCCDSNSGTV